jgi:hypothetical protein
MPSETPRAAQAASSAEILARLAAQRKAGGGAFASQGRNSRESERTAAARSASKSKPALRK